jgi:hypothetical protein
MKKILSTNILTFGTVLLFSTLPLAVLADDAPPYIINPIRCPDVLCLLVQIIRFFLGGVAVISTFMFVYGGYIFLTSAGNAEAVKKGKDTLLWAGIGIAVVLGSWVLIQFVLKGFTGVT